MMPQILEGQWEDIRAHDAELIGHRVRLTILPAESLPTQLQPVPSVPNHAMLEAMRLAAEIESNIHPQPGSDGVALVREARSGGMYGDNTQHCDADCD